MTGDRLRHRWFAGDLLRRFPDSTVVLEGFHDETGRNYTIGDVTPAMGAHFDAFDRTERDEFGDEVAAGSEALEDATILRVDVGDVNVPSVCARVEAEAPDVVVVYSTSIIKDPLLSAFGGRILNLHAGLSPYYRGAGTNLFPFYNDELEYVGMTIHHLDAGIDSGEMILQGRPSWAADDDTHTIGCGCVRLGAELMARVLERLGDPALPSVPQDRTRGRLYRKRDFDDEVLRVIRERIEGGMVARHAAGEPKAIDLVSW